MLALHPCFDLVLGVVIDDLHSLFLGVTLTLLRLWFDKTSRGKPYFIGNQVITFVYGLGVSFPTPVLVLCLFRSRSVMSDYLTSKLLIKCLVFREVLLTSPTGKVWKCVYA